MPHTPAGTTPHPPGVSHICSRRRWLLDRLRNTHRACHRTRSRADVSPFAQVSILYWMRHQVTGELLPLFVQIEDMSVLPLESLSVAPPAHCVPANLKLATEFQPELHCRIAELLRQTSTSQGATELPGVDLDLKIGLGLTPLGEDAHLPPPQLVHQVSRNSPLSSSPLVPRRDPTKAFGTS